MRFLNRRNTYLTLVVGMIVFMISCTSQPSYVISPNKMELVLYDYHIARGLADQNKYEDRFKTSIYVDNALSKHGVTKEQFDSSLVWYTRHMDQFTKIYKNVSSRLEEDKNEIDSLAKLRFDVSAITPEGDSINILPIPAIHKLTDKPLNNLISYSINTDENFKTGDKYNLVFRTKYLGNSADSTVSVLPAVANIILKLEDSKQLVQQIKLSKDSLYQIALTPEEDQKTVKVQGFFYMPMQQDNFILMIDSLALYRVHKPENIVVVDEEEDVTDSLQVKEQNIQEAN